MAATRVYSTAAYYVAAVVAILFGLSPKFGALVASTPGGVLGGITVVLYGMIGLLGAKIWKENGVDFGNPINLVPIAAGIIIGIGDVDAEVHRRLLPRPASRSARSSPSSATTSPRRWRPRELRDRADGAVLTVGGTTPTATATASTTSTSGDDRR